MSKLASTNWITSSMPVESTMPFSSREVSASRGAVVSKRKLLTRNSRICVSISVLVITVLLLCNRVQEPGLCGGRRLAGEAQSIGHKVQDVGVGRLVGPRQGFLAGHAALAH